MSQITRCPACHTQFWVSPEQLRISQGWVRCGRCEGIFDASDNLVGSPQAADTAPKPPPPDAPASSAAPVHAPGNAAALRPRVTDKWQQDLTSTFTPSQPAAADANASVAAQAPTSAFQQTVENWQHSEHPVTYALQKQGDAAADHVQEHGIDPAYLEELVRASRISQAEEHSEADSVAPPADTAHAGTRQDIEPEPAAGGVADSHSQGADTEPDGLPAETADLSFVRRAQKRAFWQRKSIRATLGLLILTLAGLLALQAALQNRHAIAAVSPAAKTWMQTLCHYAGCAIEPWRDIDALAIDSSSFQIVAPRTYELTWTVRNHSDRWVQTPALELSLLNDRDEAVIRRTLLPQDLDGRGELAPQAHWELRQGLQVASQSGDIAGYRLVIFYP